MKSIGNFLWFFIGGGLISALIWWTVGILAFISIVGIPWARACMLMGSFACFPFGKDVIDRKTLTNHSDIGTSVLGDIGNIIWFLLAGVWIAIAHIAAAIASFLTIIGIPFGIQHLKLAGLALSPIGKEVAAIEVIKAAKMSNAHRAVEEIRGNRNAESTLVTCRICNSSVSTNAIGCPHCGEPIPFLVDNERNINRNPSTMKQIVTSSGMILLALIFAFFVQSIKEIYFK
jgi:uncharacterized membrane protein YccF (DUF307 family)